LERLLIGFLLFMGWIARSESGGGGECSGVVFLGCADFLGYR
jgi:hypothetical protein